MKTPVISLVVIALACVTLTACDSLGGDDDEDIAGLIASQFVSVTVDPPDLQADGLLVSDGVVTPQTFLTQLRDRMSTISAVDINFIKLTATPGANVASWADLYQGELLVQLVPGGGGGDPVQVGRVAVPASGLGELDATVTATRQQLDAAPDIAAGNFAVRLTAGTPRAAGDEFTLPVRVEIEFAAF